MNTNIWTFIRKYEYEYEYLSHTEPKINMLLYIKVVKDRKIMHICAICAIFVTHCLICWKRL